MPWQTLPAGQRRALLQKSLATRRSRILDLAGEVGPVIEGYRAQGYGFRRIAALLNLSDHTPLRGTTWHPTTVVRVWRTYTTQPVQLKLTKPLSSSGASRAAGIGTPSPAARPGAGEAGRQDGLLRNDPAGERVENAPPDDETLAARIWRQVEFGTDESLLPTKEKRTRDLAKKMDRELDRNGWRMFVSGCAYTMANGKGPQRRNAEVMLLDTIRRWRDQVVDLLPERAADLKRIVEAGLDRPEPPPKKEGELRHGDTGRDAAWFEPDEDQGLAGDRGGRCRRHRCFGGGHPVGGVVCGRAAVCRDARHERPLGAHRDAG